MNKTEALQTTLVGISAAVTNEDWSSEFFLDGGGAAPSLRRMSSRASKYTSINDADDDWDDIDVDNDKDLSLSGGPKRLDKSRLNTSRSDDTHELSIEEEDWDDELGITDEVREGQDCLADGLRLVMSETLGISHGGLLDDLILPVPSEADAVQTTIPIRCKVVNQLIYGQDDVNLVIYPSSIALYSLKLDGDRRQLMAVELDEWLRTVVTKHMNRVETAMKTKDIAWLNKIQSKEKTFNNTLVRAWAEVIHMLLRNKSLDIWEVLQKFCKLLRHFSRMDKGMMFQFCDISETEYGMMFQHILDILRVTAIVDTEEAVSGKYTKKGPRRANYHFRVTLTDTISASPIKATKGSPPPRLFTEMIRYAVVMFPEHVEHLAVLELEAAAHHCIAMMENRVEYSWSPSPYSVFKCYLSLYRTVVNSDEGSIAAQKRRRSEPRDGKTESKSHKLNFLRTAIICDLFFILNGYNPLDVSHRPHLVAAIDELKNETGVGMLEGDERDDFISDSDESAEKTHSSSYNSDRKLIFDDRDISLNSASRTGDPRRKDTDIDARVREIIQKFNTSEHESPSDSLSRSPENKRRGMSREASNVSTLSLETSMRANRKHIRQVYDLLGDESVNFFDIFHMLTTDLQVFKNILTTKYKSVSRKSILKARVAFAMSVMVRFDRSEGEDQDDVAESLLLESIVLLDKLHNSHFNEIAPPIISSFALMAMEKFAELLISNSKYKFGVSCFESVVAAHLLANTKDEKRLYRRLTVVAQESGDIKRSLYYHCIMLRIAKDESKLNEFVYIADLVSKLFLDVGEANLAERCLRVVSLLHTGYPLASVCFETISSHKLEHSFLPTGFEIPSILLNIGEGDGGLVGGLWTKRISSNAQSSQLVCDSQQFSAISKLIDLFVCTDSHQKAIDLCLSLLKRKLFPQGRISVLLTMSKCYLKLRQLTYCEAVLDRIAYESEEVVGGILARTGTPSLTQAHQVNSTSQNSPISPRAANTSRYYRSYNDLNRAAAKEKRRHLDTTKSTPRHARQLNHTGTAGSSGAQAASLGASAAAVGFVSKVRSYGYLILRARCRLAADDPEWALHWLQIALAVCPKGKWDKRADIRYLNGRAYGKLCMRCRATDAWGRGDTKLMERESTLASLAESEFRACWTLCKKYTDNIIKQTKAMNRIVELHVSRLFNEIAVEKSVTLTDALDGKAESLLRSMDGLSRMSMQLVGDVGAPLELIRSLVNCCELSWLLGNPQLAFSAWCEAKALLMHTFLQPVTPISLSPFSRLSLSSPRSKVSQSMADADSPLRDIPVAPIPFPPGMVLRVYDLLTRIVRLAFVIEPCPLSNNGGALIASWMRFNHATAHCVTPLFSDSHKLHRTLDSFDSVFNSAVKPNAATRASPVGSMFAFADGNPSRPSLLLRVFGLENDIETALSARKMQRKKDAWLKSHKPIALEYNHLRVMLRRAVIPNGMRLAKSIPKLTGAIFNEPLLYIPQDEANLSEIFKHLKIRRNKVDGGFSTRKQFSRRSLPETSAYTGSDADESSSHDPSSEYDIEDALSEGVLEYVIAAANILFPFEIIRKAMSIDYGMEGSSSEGMEAAEIVMSCLRESAKSGLLHPSGKEAAYVKSRSTAPGITMTSEGYFVEGMYDYSDAEKIAQKRLGKPGFVHTDLLALLRHVNKIYPPWIDDSDSPRSHKAASVDTTDLENTIDCDTIDNYSALVGASPNKVRLKVLFLRLKVYKNQYIEGHLTLTEYYKRNMETMKKIVQSMSCVSDLNRRSSSPDSSASALDSLSNAKESTKSRRAPPMSPINEVGASPSLRRMISLQSSSSSQEANQSRLRSQSIEHLNALASLSDNPVNYPPSFRFVVYIDNALFLYTPLKDTTAVAILRDKVRAGKRTPPPASVRKIPRSVEGRQDTLSIASGSVRSITSSSHSHSKSIAKSWSEEEDMQSKGSSAKKQVVVQSPSLGRRKFALDSTAKTPSKSPRDRSSLPPYVKSASSFRMKGSGLSNTLRSDFTGKSMEVYVRGDREEPMYLMSAASACDGLTPPLATQHTLCDSAVMTALSDLPLAAEEDLSPDSPLSKFGDESWKNRVKADVSIVQLVKILGYQNTMFLWTTLMLEEPLLLLGSPGSEQTISHICTALLRLLRPMTWQHLYIPLMHTSMQPHFLALLRNHDPFIIGTYHEVVGHIDPVSYDSIFSDANEGLPCTNTDSGHRLMMDQHLADVTVVNLDSGLIKPGRRLQFVAACTLSSYAGVIPESDPATLKHMLGRLESCRDIIGSMHLKPPLPARYRVQVYSKLSDILDPTESMQIYPSQSGGLTALGNDSLNSVSIELESSIFSVMVSLFKGLKMFIKEPPKDIVNKKCSKKDLLRAISPRASFHMQKSRSPRGEFAIDVESHLILDESKFLGFLKDDVRPFVQYLFHTRSFKRLINGIYSAKIDIRRGENECVSSSLLRFMTLSDARLESRLILYRELSTQRLGGYLVTYFAHVLPNQEQHQYPFVYQFPYSVEAFNTLPLLSDVSRNKEQLKIKLRWCVLDAQRLTYYKSRSKRRIKDHITIDPQDVRLVLSPFCHPLPPASTAGGAVSSGSYSYSVSPSAPTTEHHSCALVFGGGSVLVFRAETINDHNQWVRALRARLVPDYTAES